jgi:hypothetical protein
MEWRSRGPLSDIDKARLREALREEQRLVGRKAKPTVEELEAAKAMEEQETARAIEDLMEPKPPLMRD